jgi:hypothetical protein
MEALQPNPRMIAELGMTLSNGVSLAKSITIPEDSYGVLAKDGDPAGVLQPGIHVILEGQYPSLKLRSQWGNSSEPALDAVCYLVRSDVADVAWTGRLYLDGPRALTYYEMRGRLTLRIVDPQAFANSALSQAFVLAEEHTQRDGSPFTNWAKATLGDAVRFLVIAGDELGPICASHAVQEVVNANPMPAARVLATVFELQNAAGEVLIGMLAQRGIQLHQFSLGAITGPAQIECQMCGAVGVPISLASYLRTVSLLFVRFQAHRAGPSCRKCALTIGVGYTLTTLVMGWWGLYGIVLSPFFIALNLYNITKVLVTARAVGTPTPPPALE